MGIPIEHLVFHGTTVRVLNIPVIYQVGFHCTYLNYMPIHSDQIWIVVLFSPLYDIRIYVILLYIPNMDITLYWIQANITAIQYIWIGIFLIWILLFYPKYIRIDCWPPAANPMISHRMVTLDPPVHPFVSH
jgi:hypothetical protein